MYYASNQTRLRAYRKERNAEEQNDNEHQFKLYSQLAIDRGNEEEAAHLADLAQRAFSKLVQQEQPTLTKETVKQLSGFEILKQAVQAKKLNELIQGISKLSTRGLSPEQRIIVKDLRNPDFKQMINEVIAEQLASDSNSDKIAEVIVDHISGSDNKIAFNALIEKARPRSSSLESIYTTTASTLTATAGMKLPHLTHAQEERFKSRNFNTSDMKAILGMLPDSLIKDFNAKAPTDKFSRTKAYLKELLINNGMMNRY